MPKGKGKGPSLTIVEHGQFKRLELGDLGTRGASVLGAVVGQVDRTPAKRAGRPSHAAKRTWVRRNVVT